MMDDPILNFDNYLSQAQAQISLTEFILNLFLTVALSFVLKKVYEVFGQSLSNRNIFGNIFVPIAMTTMIIITIVKSSLALSLGLVGALSIVRFRAAIKEPEELVYLFICIAIGLGLGANQVVVTIIGFTITVLAVIFIRKSAFKVETSNTMYLTVTKSSGERMDLDKIMNVIESNSFELDLKRLDENNEKQEISFLATLEDQEQFIKLRDEIYNLDKSLEVTFLDNSKIF